MVRELILLLKRGHLEADYFQAKFGINILDQWRDVWDEYEQAGYASVQGQRVELSRAGLLRVDSLLPAFFEPKYRDVRYT